MREYETTFIIQPEISDEGIQAIQERLDGVLDKQGATRLMYEDLGRRRLAYEIRHFQKGQYLTLFFLDEGKAVPEVERTLRLDDSILRYLTVMADPQVRDVEARVAEAAEAERIRAERAAEKAAREAEEAARAAELAKEAEAAALAAETARSAAAAEAAAAAPSDEATEAAEDAPSDETAEAAASDEAPEPPEDAPAAEEEAGPAGEGDDEEVPAAKEG